MTEKFTTTEDKMAEALRLLDRGSSPREIIERFPEIADELSGMFRTMTILNAAKDVIEPPQVLLKTIIEEGLGVPSAQERAPVLKASSARLASTGPWAGFWQALSSRNVLLPMGALVLIVAAFAGIRILPPQGGGTSEVALRTFEAATGDPDDIASMLINAARAETDTAAGETDQDVIASDAAELNSYQVDENQF